jgi:hypothetical protein
MKKRYRLLLAIAITSIVTVIGWRYTTHNKNKGASTAVRTPEVSVTAKQAETAGAKSEETLVSQPVRQSQGPAVIDMRQVPARYILAPASLPSYVIEFELMAGKLKSLKLTEEQLRQLQDAYVATQEARLDYEVSVAESRKISDREVAIEIPAYPELGKKLKEMVKANFVSTLGEKDGLAALREIGPEIDGRNKLWGEYPQQIVFRLDAGSNQYAYTHTINPGAAKREFSETLSTYLSASNLDKYSKFAAFLPATSNR